LSWYLVLVQVAMNGVLVEAVRCLQRGFVLAVGVAWGDCCRGCVCMVVLVPCLVVSPVFRFCKVLLVIRAAGGVEA
jgi:hypothetical protein